MSDEILKPCPFCGGEAFLHVVEPHKHELATWMPDYGGGAFIECTQCTVGVSAETEEEAIKTWNTRKPMERIVEKLEEELKLACKAKRQCVGENASQFDSAKGYAAGIYNAIQVVKGGGADE